MSSTDEPSNHKRSTGRRSGDSRTKEDILDAARILFAEHGYDGASLRSIATDAGVDPALIRHFFGDKATLFAVTMAHRNTIPEQLIAALAGDPDQLGTRISRTYLDLWEDSETRPILLALVRSATTSERAAAMLGEMLSARVGGNIPAPSSKNTRALILAASHLLGIAMVRYIMKMPAMTQLSQEDIVAQVAPSIQRYFSEAQH